MRLAVIPARGGSKRIPRKNIKPFAGKPMIAWSIAAALESKCFDVVAISTDDAEIAEVARGYGAEIPFMRPLELSDDRTGTIPVVRHAVEWYFQQGAAPSEVCCLYATAPFIRAADIRLGLDVLTRSQANYAFTVTTYPSPIQRAFRLTGEGRVEMFHPELYNTRSQELEVAYHDAAQFYWGRASAWLAEERVFGASASVVVLPRYRVQDIDTQEDWVMAQYLFEVLKQAGCLSLE